MPIVRSQKPVFRSAFLSFFSILMFLAVASKSTAVPHASAICDDAASIAAKETGVPLSVLRAITRTETGRTRGKTLQPWAWTINMEGEGVWFETKDEARFYVSKHFQRGARSFDVGCFQINYKWHGQEFATIDEMFDPVLNARYAAKFIASLYEETGDWPEAAGAYHSRTKKYANRYITRFNRIYAAQSNVVTAFTQVAENKNKPNSFPLLQVQANAPKMGSLVPLGTSAGQGLFSSRAKN